MQNTKCLIFASAEIYDYDFIIEYLNDSTIICCDGGIKHTKKLNIKPDFIIGDLDSADSEILDFYKNENVTIYQFPSKKEFTDLELCLDFAINNDFKEIFVFGAIGSRMDHTLTNIHLLKSSLEKGVKAYLLNENNFITLIDDKIRLSGKKGDFISLIPLTDIVKSVTTAGLAYPLCNEDLFLNSSRGISNVFSSDFADISIKGGLLLIIKSFDIQAQNAF